MIELNQWRQRARKLYEESLKDQSISATANRLGISIGTAARYINLGAHLARGTPEILAAKTLTQADRAMTHLNEAAREAELGRLTGTGEE